MTLRFEVAYVHLCHPRRVRGEVQARWSLDNVAAPRIPVRVRVRVADPGLRGGCGLSTRYRHGLGLWRIILASLLIASRRLPRFQETEGPDEAVGTPASVVVVRTNHTTSGFWYAPRHLTGRSRRVPRPLRSRPVGGTRALTRRRRRPGRGGRGGRGGLGGRHAHGRHGLRAAHRHGGMIGAARRPGGPAAPGLPPRPATVAGAL